MPHPSAPSSALPLFYFGVAHAALALALAALLVNPALAGAFFFHPRMVALVHLVTVGWLTGSILGAMYIAAPLALRLPLPVRAADWWAAVAWACGLSGIVSHAWLARYDGLAWSAALVLWPVVLLAWRVARGARAAVVPWPILLHVGLAFVNMMAAGVYGAVIGWDKARGTLPASPMLLAFAHAHLAAIGWVVMMVVGLAYRLVPMFLPSAMPVGGTLAISAVLIQAGLLVVVAALPVAHESLPWGAALIVAGVVSFGWHLGAAMARPMPRPPALPARDWSMWQVRTALGWLVVAMGAGAWLTVSEPSPGTVRLMWVYGVAGLMGGLAQVVTGMQGRLMPLYLWYRFWAAHPEAPPATAANALPSGGWALAVFLPWCLGTPLLAFGLSTTHPAATSVAAGVLLLGVVFGWMNIGRMQRRLSTSR